MQLRPSYFKLYDARLVSRWKTLGKQAQLGIVCWNQAVAARRDDQIGPQALFAHIFAKEYTLGAPYVIS